MTCRFLDSVKHYQTAHLTAKYNAVGINVIVHPTDGYSGDACLESSNGGAGNSLIRTMDSQSGWIVGFRYYTGTLPGGSGDFINFTNSAATQDQCSFNINPAGTMSAYRGDWDFGSTLLGTSGVISLQNDTWYFLEFKVIISDTVGEMHITINGTAVLDLTGQDTRFVSNAFGADADSIRISLSSTGGTARIQDIHILDTSGGVNNDMIGEYSVECLFPAGIGNSSGWTPSGGAVDNYTMVDEKTVTFPDGDTTYNSAAGAVEDTYAMDDLAVSTGTVKAIQVVSYDRKDDAGAVSIHHVIRSNGGDHDSADIGLGDNYVFNLTQWDTDPGFGGNWSITHVNAAEIGMERA